MSNDPLDRLWDRQKKEMPVPNFDDLLAKAQKHRKGQFLTITILAVTVLILFLYALYFASTAWNDFTLGLFLMISSLVFRVILEAITLYRKESKLITLDNRAFRKYLEKHYRVRLGINYGITPLCFGVYVLGFAMLLPFFEREFSSGFYWYILISGTLSLLVILGIIIYSVIREHRFLKQLKNE